MTFNCLNCNVSITSTTRRKYCGKACQLSHWYSLNKERKVQRQKELRHADPERYSKLRLKIRLKALYNLTVEQFNEMSDRQNDVCAICSRLCPSGRLLSVDHCHRSGKIRGLLCMRCNKALGLFDDNIPNILKAVEYLRKNAD